MTETGLDVPNTPRCAFCDYLNSVRPFTVLWRSRVVAVLVTREQRGKPHLLVMPIRHCETILELANSEAQELMLAIRDSARAINAAFCRDGIAVWQNNGEAANQRIPHLHFHVAGTLDSGGTERGSVSEISVEETNRIGASLLPFWRKSDARQP